MNNLGPAPTSRLEPLRPGDRDRGQREKQTAPPRHTHTSEPAPLDGSVEDLVKENETHQLDERA
jgi:hypothetical protein